MSSYHRPSNLHEFYLVTPWPLRAEGVDFVMDGLTALGLVDAEFTYDGTDGWFKAICQPAYAAMVRDEIHRIAKEVPETAWESGSANSAKDNGALPVSSASPVPFDVSPVRFVGW